MTSRDQILDAARAAVTTIIHEAANELTASPATYSTDERQERQAHYLACLDVCGAVGADPSDMVTRAREHRVTWADIGEALGMSRQAAHSRWGLTTAVGPEMTSPLV